MKIIRNIVLSILVIFLININCFAIDDSGKIGTLISKWGYKTYITYIVPNSPADKADLPLGAEIFAINDTKTVNLSLDEILKSVRGPVGSKVTLIVKIGFRKYPYTIVREKLTPKVYPQNKVFEKHWQLIEPEREVTADSVYLDIFSHYPEDMKWEFIKHNYWLSRRDGFKKGFDVCSSYSANSRTDCYMKLVDREIQKTQADKNYELQQKQMNQQAIMNSINSFNSMQINNNLRDINYSLRGY